MDCSANSMILVVVLTLFLVFRSEVASHVSLGSPRIYYQGDLVSLNVNSLTSTAKHLPFGYYSLPFCKPLDGVQDYARDIGELLTGEQVQNSPYKIIMYRKKSETFLCQTDPLSIPDHVYLKRMIEEIYQVNMYLDHLLVVKGFPVGVRVDESYYVFNHLKFRILVHREENEFVVVGFEVVPCSYMHNPDSVEHLRMYAKYPHLIHYDHNSVAMKIEENKPIVYSYEVTFEESNIKWPHRWDAYFKTKGSYVRWFYIVNSSLLVIAFLSGLS